jgi:hypothetical protein
MDEKISNPSMVMLTPKNYHLWIKELQKLAEQHRVWEYVDPNGTKSEPIIEEYPDFSDFTVALDATVATRSNVPADQRIRPARSINELTPEQQKDLQQRQSTWPMREKLVRRAERGIQTVHLAVKASARQYIPPSEMGSSTRQILQTLAGRYKQSDAKIVELLHEQYHALKTPPVKAKIEQWISEWENLRSEMIIQGFKDTFGNDVIFVHEFLRAGKRWAPVFCETWAIQHQAAEKPLDFFKTTRAYRDAYENFLRDEKTTARGMAGAATLQGAGQDQADPHTCTKNGKGDEKHKGKTCICGQIHLFSQCPYIVSANRTPGWKENTKVRNEARQKIQQKPYIFHSIKRVADTNILDGMTPPPKRKRGGENGDEKGKAPSDGDDPHFNFANSALANPALMTSYHPLMNSVIYDSGCSQPLTFDKTRFLDDLTPSNDQIKTPDGHMQVEGYGTMRVWGQLKGKKVEMTFKKTAYIPTCSVTLVSQNKLEKEGFDRDPHTKTLIHLKTGKQVCEIQGRFGVQLLEYNPVSRDDQMVANSVQPSKNTMVKATPWMWHQRLGHCRPQVIDHLPKEWIITSGEAAPKTVKCQTCAVSKMHRLVQKAPSGRATKPFEVLHFDYSWVFPLNDHREKTLMPVFKGLINRCDRSGIAINSMVRTIRTGQETSIGKRLEDWIINQGITWDWSAKNTPEQNGKSERYGALLTEKARCIREHAKLPEDLFPECYLAAEHLMNRTPNQALDWDSPLVRLNKPLLKGADAPPRGSKLKPRAFVGYLIGYNSTNIFRVWNQ